MNWRAGRRCVWRWGRWPLLALLLLWAADRLFPLPLPGDDLAEVVPHDQHRLVGIGDGRDADLDRLAVEGRLDGRPHFLADP